jgi:hypothetical protein
VFFYFLQNETKRVSLEAIPNAEDGSGRKYAAQKAAYLTNIEFEK